MSELSKPAAGTDSNAIQSRKAHGHFADSTDADAKPNEQAFQIIPIQRHGAGEYDWSGAPLSRQDVMKIVRRQCTTVITCCILALIAGLVFVLLSTPYYTARTQILVEPTSQSAFEDQSGALHGRVDLVELDSQVEIIKSRGLAAQVVDKHDLMNVPTFTTDPNWLEQIVSLVRARLHLRPYPDTKGPAARRSLAIDKLLKNLSALRVGNSKIVEIKYTAADPELATTLANTFALEYLADRQDVERNANERRLAWLKQRVMELQQQTIASSLAVQSFRHESDLQVAKGRPVGAQDVAALIGQVKRARAETTEAAARYQRYRQEVVESHIPDEWKLNNSTSSLRMTEINSSSRDNQKAGLDAQQQIKHIEGARKKEIEETVNYYRRKYEAAKIREQALGEHQRKIMANLTPLNRSVILRDLEREAETYRSMFVKFMTRLQEASQKQSFVTHHGRVVSSALQPAHPSFPRVKLVLLISLALGMVIGIAIGAFREWSFGS